MTTLVLLVLDAKTRKKNGKSGALILTKTPNKTDVKPAIKAINNEKIKAKTKISSFRIFFIFRKGLHETKKRTVKNIRTKLSIPLIINVGDIDSFINGLYIP